MPDEPIILDVLKALTASLEEITQANGYWHDLNGRVFRGRMTFSDGDPLPMLSINQPPTGPEEIEAPVGAAVRNAKHVMLVQGFVDDDIQNPTDPAFYLLHDVERRLAWERKRDEGYNVLGFDGQVMLSVGQGVVRSPDGVVADTAYFWLPITLEVPHALLA